MFYLWTGVMAGMLLAYLVKRIQTRRPRWPWPALWWLALVLLVLLLAPAIRDTWHYTTGSLGPAEALKGVLLPWIAGAGFGVWMYYLIAPQLAGPPRRAAAARFVTETKPTEAKNDNEGNAAVLGATAFIPIGVALLVVMLIVNENDYGWIGRLQKITLGGNSVELAPSESSSSLPVGRFSQSSPFSQSSTGGGRIDQLLHFMGQLPDAIKRDTDVYPREAGFAEADIKGLNPGTDGDFAHEVVKPLADRLVPIHAERGYDAIEFIAERKFIDDFRAFVQAQGNDAAPPTNGRGSVDNVSRDFLEMLSKLCDAEHKSKDDCEIDELKAAFLSRLPAGKAQTIFDPNLPYGTLVAAMLLYAGGEWKSAVHDLDLWADTALKRWHPKASTDAPANASGDAAPKDDSPKLFGLYRVRLTSAQLAVIAATSPEADSTAALIAISELRKVVELGDQLLMRDKRGPSGISWRRQMRRLERNDPEWLLGTCANDLGTGFKITAKAHLNMLNMLAYFLSQDVALAMHEGLFEDMRKRGDQLAKQDVSCLQPDQSDLSKTNAKSTQALFLDTAAAVQLAVASVAQLRPDKRSTLCRAQRYAKDALHLFDEAGGDRQVDWKAEQQIAGATSTAEAQTFAAAIRQAEISRIGNLAIWSALSDRVARAQNELEKAGMDCAS